VSIKFGYLFGGVVVVFLWTAYWVFIWTPSPDIEYEAVKKCYRAIEEKVFLYPDSVRWKRHYYTAKDDSGNLLNTKGGSPTIGPFAEKSKNGEMNVYVWEKVEGGKR